MQFNQIVTISTTTIPGDLRVAVMSFWSLIGRRCLSICIFSTWRCEKYDNQINNTAHNATKKGKGSPNSIRALGL